MKHTRKEARETIAYYVNKYLNDNLDKETYINGLLDELCFDEKNEFDDLEQGMEIPARHNISKNVITIY